MSGFILLIFVLIFNLWIWKISSSNILLALIIFITSILLYLYYFTKEVKILAVFVLFFLTVLIYQITLSDSYDLVYLDNDEQRIQSQRFKEYPPVHLQILNRHIWIKAENFFEKRKEFLAYTRFTQNFIDNLDINRYFFGGYPRQKPVRIDFEKFPVIFLPFFIIGFFISFKKKNLWIFLLIFLTVSLSAYLGNKNRLGLFAAFPFFVLLIVLGLQSTYAYIKHWRYKKTILVSFFVLAILTFIQQIIYGKL